MYDSCKKTGFYAFDPHAIESSPFVRDIPAQPEARRRIARLEIGGQVLNSTAMINSIVRMLQTCPQFTHLCCLPRAGVTYVDYVKDVCKKSCQMVAISLVGFLVLEEEMETYIALIRMIQICPYLECSEDSIHFK